MYKAFVASGAEHVERALDLLHEHTPPGGRVLEIGTRSAAILTALKGLVGPQGQVTGIAMTEKEVPPPPPTLAQPTKGMGRKGVV